ncbi:hypothetical protein B0H17DRAFT_512221 [Mycena rosella]|uniref:F-box domain-containing protein n=1 Tax=Mycena rosella TaxID=1033263 RepID=A0AAD7GL09_MYCRO|nr:hypothetical protein B0H17DRAFT_512221 [Mycena rosella]
MLLKDCERTQDPLTTFLIVKFLPSSFFKNEGFEHAPLEIRSEIFGYLNMRDITAIAHTCTFFPWYFADKLKSRMDLIFSSWGLDWKSVNFMLKLTDSLISGPAGQLFIHPNSDISFCPVVNFYIWSTALHVVLTWLAAAAPHLTESSSVDHPHHMLTRTNSFHSFSIGHFPPSSSPFMYAKKIHMHLYYASLSLPPTSISTGWASAHCIPN